MNRRLCFFLFCLVIAVLFAPKLVAETQLPDHHVVVVLQRGETRVVMNCVPVSSFNTSAGTTYE